MSAGNAGGGISAVPGVWEMPLKSMELFGARILVMLESTGLKNYFTRNLMRFIAWEIKPKVQVMH